MGVPAAFFELLVISIRLLRLLLLLFGLGCCSLLLFRHFTFPSPSARKVTDLPETPLGLLLMPLVMDGGARWVEVVVANAAVPPVTTAVVMMLRARWLFRLKEVTLKDAAAGAGAAAEQVAAAASEDQRTVSFVHVLGPLTREYLDEPLWRALVDTAPRMKRSLNVSRNCRDMPQ